MTRRNHSFGSALISLQIQIRVQQLGRYGTGSSFGSGSIFFSFEVAGPWSIVVYTSGSRRANNIRVQPGSGCTTLIFGSKYFHQNPDPGWTFGSRNIQIRVWVSNTGVLKSVYDPKWLIRYRNRTDPNPSVENHEWRILILFLIVILPEHSDNNISLVNFDRNNC